MILKSRGSFAASLNVFVLTDCERPRKLQQRLNDLQSLRLIFQLLQLTLSYIKAKGLVIYTHG